MSHLPARRDRVCQHRSSHGPRDTDLLQQVAVQHRILIPLSLLIVLPVVSSAVFLSVRPSLIAIRFGSSSQLLSRSFSFRHDGEVGRWKEGEGGRGREGEAGKHALLIKLQA